MKKFIPYLLIIFFIPKIIVLSGCANIIPPSGGPRDSLPPVLLHVAPPDSSKGFNSGKIIFTFNEFVELNNLQDNLIVSPVPAIQPNLDDSAVAKDRPRYFTRLDNKGNFQFKNLPAGRFAIYALKDEGGMKKYSSKKQLFAFADQPMNITRSNPPVTLYAYSEAEETKPVPVPSGRTPAKAVQDKALRIQTNLQNGQLDLLSQLEIQFNASLKILDTSKIRLTNEVYGTIQGVKYVLDSTRKKLTVQNNWLSNRGYSLILDKDFAADSAGRKLLKNDTLAFRTKNTSDYGSLKMRFINLDLRKHPVLQFVQNDQVKYSYVFTNPLVNIKLFIPGDYELRILYDENQNGKWDPGEFFGKHKQPEKVQPLERKLSVKANWDNDVDITL